MPVAAVAASRRTHRIGNGQGSAALAVRRHQLIAFFVLTFAISWMLWISLAAAALPITTTVGAVLNVVAIAGQSIAAVLVTIRLGQFRELLAGFSPSRLSGRW